MPGSCLADRLGRHAELSAGERDALQRLEERVRPVRRGATLLRANDRSADLFVLRRGAVMSFVLLDDGSRQILRFHFPGDLLGSTALVGRSSAETLVALTDAEVCPFDRTLLARVMGEQPRLATVLMAMEQVERLALTDRLAALGRTPARGRVAALLIEMRDRMRTADRSIRNCFALGLTQEEIGDATGLTAVHVNRMLRQLEDEGLIARTGGHFTLLDEPGLTRAARYINRYDQIDLGWLPPAAE